MQISIKLYNYSKPGCLRNLNSIPIYAGGITCCRLNLSVSNFLPFSRLLWENGLERLSTDLMFDLKIQDKSKEEPIMSASIFFS